MTDRAHAKAAGGQGTAVVREVPVDGEVPRYQVPGWRERFGAIAGITGRGGGGGPGFDLGLWSAQPVGEVMTRWRRLRGSEPSLTSTVLGTQVHGAEVVWHDGAAGWLQLDGIDGHATAAPGVRLTVTVADCVPVYLLVPERRAAALLHAGWRGTAAGILTRGVRLLQGRTGCVAQDIVMHCGVAICGDCYEVGREVMDALGLPADGPGPWPADLRARLAEEAQALGIADISLSAWCTAHDRPRFFSHRASHGQDGRMAAYLGWPAGG